MKATADATTEASKSIVDESKENTTAEKPNSTGARLPLQGLKVLSLEQYGAGPFCTQYLATFGADVIKIENRKSGGDVARASGPFKLGDEDSLYFQSFNQGKKSLSLDLKHPQGKEILHRLVRQVDVVANNVRGDQAAILGITYDQLKAVNAKIVCAHLTAYGREGERKSWPGYDYLMQAESGLMELTGEPNGLPQRMGLSMIDYMTGMNQLFSIMAGVFQARETGQGSEFDVCLFDTALFQLTYPALWYMNQNYDTQRQPRSAHPDATPSQMIKTRDGWIFIMLQTEKFWSIFCELVPAAGLTDNPAYANMAGRRANREAISEQLDQLFANRSTEEWLSVLQGKVPVAPIKTMAEALSSSLATDSGMLQQVSHPAQEDMQVLSNPIKMHGQRLQSSAAPHRIGQHNEELLSGIGYSKEEISSLAEKGVI